MSHNKLISDKCDEFNNVLSVLMTQIKDHVNSAHVAMLKSYMYISPTGPIETFLVTALPLRNKIYSRDESYFNDESNYNDEVLSDKNVMEEFMRLKNIYFSLDQLSKTSLWDILTALLILGEEYVKLTHMC